MRRIFWNAPLRALCLATLLVMPTAAFADVDPAEEPQGAHVLKEKKVRLNAGKDNIVRKGPGREYGIVDLREGGETFVVIAKSGEWYNVRLSENETGWIHASLCEEFDDMSDLEFRPNPRLFSRVGSFALYGYGGAYAFDRKSNSMVLGGGLGYQLFEFVSVEGGLAWTHVTRPAEIVEDLFGLTLVEEDFHMLYYALNVNLKLLPGRQMVPYLTGGVGTTIMRGETESGFNFGAGTTLHLSRHTAMRWEFRDYRFDSGSGAARRRNNNVEFSLGTMLLF